MTEIGIIFERVKIVPRVIEILNSIARYSELSLGICFKSEIDASKLYSIRCNMCKENPPLTLPEMNRTHGSLPASATSFDGRLYQNGKGRKPMCKFSKTCRTS